MIKTTSRVAQIGALSAVVALAVGTAAVTVHSAKAQSENKAEATEKAPEASAGMVIAIDPATGKIRTPEPSEINALTALAPSNKKAAEAKVAPQPFALPGGGVGLMVDRSFDCAVVATQTSDGKAKTDCLVGEEDALAVAQAKQSQKTERLDEK